MKVLVGSKNPVKLQAVKKAFHFHFPQVEVEGYSVLSRVASQPWNEEVILGARNRARAVAKINRGRKLGASFFVGIESGIFSLSGKEFVGGCVCIQDTEEKEGIGFAPMFEVPSFFLPYLREGKELSSLVDTFFQEKKSGEKQGAVGFLSKGQVLRKDLYYLATSLALLPFVSCELYEKED